MLRSRPSLLPTVAGLAALLAAGLAAAVLTHAPLSIHTTAAVTGLHVAGNRILNGSGQVVRPLGVNRPGTEYICTSSGGFFDGPSDSASVQAIASWGINAVRIPLNEDCWLGINGLPAGGSSSAAYRQAVVGYVNLLHSFGMLAIVDLHWNAPGSTPAHSQQVMADLDHAPAFWTSVATTFRGDLSVMFDLYNEPNSISWNCWLNGGSCASFPVAGMQTLVNAVRATGATNVILAGGLAWSNDLSGWLANQPRDPIGNLAASFHLYNFNACLAACWNSTVAAVAASVPIVADEIGENDCAHGFVDSAMAFFDSHGIGYLPWGWVVASCGGFPSLITAYDGTPTAYGAGVRAHLQAQAGSSGGSPTPAPVASGPTPSSRPVPTPSQPAAPPSSTPVPSATPRATAPPTPGSTDAGQVTFEDGTTGGWAPTGHVSGVYNSTAAAFAGTHSLRVDLQSTGPTDCPFVQLATSGASAPRPGQTVTVHLLVPSGAWYTQAKVYVQDSAYAWHMGTYTPTGQGSWATLSLRVPPGISVIALGVQFLATPYNTTGTVYLDSITWS